MSEKRIRVNGALSFEQSFSWTDLGRVQELGYPECQSSGCGGIGSRSVDYSYTKGLLTNVSEGTTQYASSISYYPNLMPYEITHGNGSPGVIDRWTADPDGMRRPRRIQTLNIATAYDSGVYRYDGAGNITEMGADNFVYDDVSRLVSGTAARGAGLQTVVYDKHSTIKEITTDGVTRDFKVSNLSGRLLENCYRLQHYPSADQKYRRLFFDERGNLIHWGALRSCSGYRYTWMQLYEWDSANMMTEHREYPGAPWATAPDRTTRFLYTADDERIGRVEVDESRTFWTVRDLGGQVLRTFEENNTTGGWSWVKDFIWRDGKLLASQSPATGRLHYHLDHLGTPRLVTNSAGGFHRRHDYYPFGEEYQPTDTTEVMRFTGHEKDFAGMGGEDKHGDLEYMHARYFSGYMGRFLSLDPVNSATPEDPQTWNRYVYARNNPLKFTDPDGEAIVFAFDENAALREAIRERLTFAGPRGGTLAAIADLVLADFLPTNVGEVQGQIDGLVLSLVPGGGQLSGATSTLTERVVKSAGEAFSRQISVGARAIAKKLGRASREGFTSAFANLKPTSKDAEKVIREVLANPIEVLDRGKHIDVFSASGRGLRIEKDTGNFVTFLEEALKK